MQVYSKNQVLPQELNALALPRYSAEAPKLFKQGFKKNIDSEWGSICWLPYLKLGISIPVKNSATSLSTKLKSEKGVLRIHENLFVLNSWYTRDSISG
mmetsp:Transcript_1263/g.1845  ORF Transcript_1263/g.1845 Transcript_1263/m.1845 type:complete len:98 (-) Transcript_1263:348-641(-)